MKDHFVKLFLFNEWANGRLLSVLGRSNYWDQKISALMVHVVAAQGLWLDRTHLKQGNYRLWEPKPLEEVVTLARESDSAWNQFAASLTAIRLSEQIPYVNTRGVAYQNTIQEILTHVINHGSHHRGQANLLIRQAGFEPPLIDFIAFVRNEE